MKAKKQYTKKSKNPVVDLADMILKENEKENNIIKIEKDPDPVQDEGNINEVITDEYDSSTDSDNIVDEYENITEEGVVNVTDEDKSQEEESSSEAIEENTGTANNEGSAIPKKPRIILDNGISKHNPFVVNKNMNEVYDIIEKHFGNKDGDWCVRGENTQTNINAITNLRKRYKCILLQDKNSYYYSLWFDITNLNFLY